MAQAAQANSTLAREIERTGDEFIAAMEIMARWEDANPWPSDATGVTGAHWEWRRQKNAVDETCGFTCKAKANIAAYRAAREAGVYAAI